MNRSRATTLVGFGLVIAILSACTPIYIVHVSGPESAPDWEVANAISTCLVKSGFRESKNVSHSTDFDQGKWLVRIFPLPGPTAYDDEAEAQAAQFENCLKVEYPTLSIYVKTRWVPDFR